MAKPMNTWSDLSQRLSHKLGLTTRPLGFKFIRDVNEINSLTGLERPTFKRTICQFIGSARFLGKSWIALPEDQLCQWGAFCIGVFPEVPEALIAGCLYSDKYLKIADGDNARRIARNLPMKKEKSAALAVMPLFGITFEPDLVIVYGDAEQLTRIILPTCSALGLPALEGRILGDTGICADGIPATWNSGQPKFFLPCTGDRAFGGTRPSEVAIIYPARLFNEDVVSNIEKFKYAPNWSLEAPLGASPEIKKLMIAMSASTFPLDTGTPLIPKQEP